MKKEKYRPYISRDTDAVYEIDRRSKKVKHIHHGVDSYLRQKYDPNASDYYEEEDDEGERIKDPEERRLEILSLMKKKQITTKASGPKDIAIEDRRKRNKKAKVKRKKMRKK